MVIRRPQRRRRPGTLFNKYGLRKCPSSQGRPIRNGTDARAFAKAGGHTPRRRRQVVPEQLYKKYEMVFARPAGTALTLGSFRPSASLDRVIPHRERVIRTPVLHVFRIGSRSWRHGMGAEYSVKIADNELLIRCGPATTSRATARRRSGRSEVTKAWWAGLDDPQR